MTAMGSVPRTTERAKNYNNATSKVIPMDLNSLQFIFASIGFDQIAFRIVGRGARIWRKCNKKWGGKKKTIN